MSRNIAVSFFLLLLSPNTPQPQMSAESWRGLIIYQILWRGLKPIPSGTRGPTMNKQLNHQKADFRVPRENFGAPLGQGVLKEIRKIPQTQMQHARCSHCEATGKLQWQQCNNERVQRSTNNRMPHWELICLWCFLELHLHRMNHRQTHTAPAVVPVGETCLFASRKC